MAFEYLYRDPPPFYIPSMGKYACEGRQWAHLFPDEAEKHGIPQGPISWEPYDKLMEFSGRDDLGFPNIYAVTRAGSTLEKTASPFPAIFLEKISELPDDPNKVYVVANALGADETWSSNANGDAMPRMGLMNSDPDTYGHKTYEKIGYVYQHHRNKDPKNAIGKVVHSFWDDDMDKVLLLYYLLKDKAPHIIKRLEDGEVLDTSMGLRCPFDVCSMCGKKSKTRAEYCDDLKYHMNATMPDGRKARAITPHPRLFDHSHVLRGADKIAKALMIIDRNGLAKQAWDSRTLYFPMYPRETGASLYLSNNSQRITFHKIAVNSDMQETNNQEAPFGSPVAEHVQPGIFGMSTHQDESHPYRVEIDHGKTAYFFPSRETALGFMQSWSTDHPYDPASGPFDKNAQLKAADIIKRVTATMEKPKEGPDPRVEDFARDSLPQLEKKEEPLPGNELQDLGESHGLDEILSSLTQQGIILSPQEFQRLVLSHHGAGDIAEELEQKGVDFSQVGDQPNTQAPSFGGPGAPDISQKNVRSDILKKTAHWMPKRSYHQPYLYKRAFDLLAPLAKVLQGSQAGIPNLPPGTKIIIITPGGEGESPHGQMMPQAQAPNVHMPQMPAVLPALLAIRALYDAYRTNLGKSDIHKAYDEPLRADYLQKGASPYIEDLIEYWKGVPAAAYAKYAFCNPHGTELCARGNSMMRDNSPAHTFMCSDIVSEALIVNPLEAHEKRGSAYLSNLGELVDAATVMSLRFVGRFNP